jgi:hypothetical protein
VTEAVVALSGETLHEGNLAVKEELTEVHHVPDEIEAECDRTTVSLIERGLVSPKLVTVVKMCKAITALPSDVMREMEKSRLYS